MHRAVLSLVLITGMGACADELPHKEVTLASVARPVTPAQVAAADLSVFPDGTGLPPGRGTAREGKEIYAAQCAACHGDQGEGRGDYSALVGGRGSLASATPVLTIGSYWPYATSIWDYIRRAMPYQSAGSLSTNEVYAVTTWLLYANGIVSEDTVLDQRTLARVKMPNHDGFVDDPRPDIE